MHHDLINRTIAKIEAKGFTVEQVFQKRGSVENIPCGRSSSVTVTNWVYLIEFSKDDGLVFGTVEAFLVEQRFNKKNPYDRYSCKPESARFEASEETKKLLDWK